jgi:hypothetical protein
MKEAKILTLTDILEQKVRKEKELEYYQEELERLMKKMRFVQQEIDLTNKIIYIIEQEKSDILKVEKK